MEERWERLFHKKLETGMTAEYYAIRLLDFCLQAMSDEDMERLLGVINIWDLVIVMKLLSGAAYKKIHDHLSEATRTTLLEGMENAGRIPEKEIAEKDSEIFQIILKLGQKQVISVPGNLDQIFEVCGNTST